MLLVIVSFAEARVDVIVRLGETVPVTGTAVDITV